METLLNELQENRNALVERKKKLVTKGYFNLNLSGSKCRLRLKGDFSRSNINLITRSMMKSKTFHKGVLDLDMSEVNTIDMQAMALLIITLKTLKENGTNTKVTGLNDQNLKLASELGMGFITQIN